MDKRSHKDRGQGRKPELGTLRQVQVRVLDEEEFTAIKKLSPRDRAEVILAYLQNRYQSVEE